MSERELRFPPYPWQQAQWQVLCSAKSNQRLPHGLLLHGSHGMGKNDFAEALAQLVLCEVPKATAPCQQCRACQLFLAGTHPDFKRISPEAPGKAIKIDNIRTLISDLSQHAQRGQHKVVILTPAEAMNTAAANALLKTLEEPTANTLLLLVTEHLEGISATIRSRCQQLTMKVPRQDVGLDWLAQQQAVAEQQQLVEALDFADGAPLAAQALLTDNTLVLRTELTQDLLALYESDACPVGLADIWWRKDKNLDGPLLQTLVPLFFSIISQLVYCHLRGSLVSEHTALTTLAERIALVDALRLLTECQEVQRKLVSVPQLNVQLLLESWFINWKHVLQTVE